MSDVKIIQYNNRFYIKSSHSYFINISNTDKVLNVNKNNVELKTFDKSEQQQFYIWQCMNDSYDFLLQPLLNNKILNVDGGFNLKSSIIPTNETGPKLILYNEISKYSNTCYNSPSMNLQDNNIFCSNDNNSGYIISTIVTIKKMNSLEYLQESNNKIFMGLNASNIKYVNSKQDIVEYPGNNKERKLKSFDNYFTLNTGGQYKFYRSKNSYYIRSGSYVFDVTGGNKINGTKVQLYTYNGTTAQQWYIWKDNFNRIGFENVGSGRWLDLPDGNKIKNGQQNAIQMQIYTEVKNRTIHQNQMYSLINKEKNQYYIQNTYCKVLDWVVAGMANNKDSAVSFQKKSKDNYILLSTNGNDEINFNNIEFELPTYTKFDTTPYYIYTEAELNGKNYEFGNLITPSFNKTLEFKERIEKGETLPPCI